ncbi:MAG: hypothetical protein HQM08_04425 [Candidatus Riflebacteria bacterium]|nr:hypothetical protein [Candidatus Riflebacteria bacterium]
MKSRLRAIIHVLLLVAATIVADPAFAGPPVGVSGAISVSNEIVKVDGKAAIGETLNFQVIFTSDELATSNAASVDLTGIGGPLVTMTCNTTGTTVRGDATWVVTGGTSNNSPFTPRFIISNASGPVPYSPSSSIYVDNSPPNRSALLSATVDGSTYSGTAVKKGQVVNFSQGMSSPDMGSASINLAAANLSAVNGMTWSAPVNFFLNGIVFPDGLDTTCLFPIQIADSCGNTVSYGDFTMNIDTKPPSVTSASVINQAGSTVPALPGHNLNFTVTIAAYDGDTAIASQSTMQNAGISMPTLTPTSSPTTGNSCTFQGTLNLPQNSAIHGSNYPFDFVVTDNAGNQTTFRAYLTSIDLDPPNQTTAQISVFQAAPNNNFNPPPWDSVASIGSRLVISSDITTSSGDTLSVTANLTSIGGPASYPLTLAYGNTYIATYTIPQGSLENDTDHTFSVYAKDQAGNIVYQSTTPNIRIDNFPPSFASTPTVTKSGGGSQFLLGDTLTITANANNVEYVQGGRVTVDLSAFGLSATTLMDNPSGNTFTKSFKLTTTTFVDNGGFSFKVTAVDDVGNPVTANSGAVGIDNEPPVLLSASYTVNPKLSASKQYVRIGDDLTLNVILASTTGSTAYDGQYVNVDLSSVGGSSNQPMNLSAGVYSFSFKVTAGSITDSAIFPLTISDNAGNGPTDKFYTPLTPLISIAQFDNNPPNPGALTVTGKDWVESVNVVNIGDQMTFTFPLTLSNPDDHGDATIDLSTIGGDSAATMTYSNSSYFLAFTATSTLTNLKNSAYYFKASVSDKAGNIVTVTNGPTSVDCWPPKIQSVLVSPSSAVIGSSLSFHVKTAEEDGGVPFLDLSALGLSATQNMTASTTAHGWDYTTTVATGSLYNETSASFMATIKDVSGNIATAVSPAITLDNVPPKTSGVLAVSWNDVPADGKIKLGDTLSFSLQMNEDVGQIGTAYLDLTAVGGGAAVAMVPPPFPTGNYVYTFTTTQTTQEYDNYSFKASLTDSSGNKFISTASAILHIDCFPPSFSNSGILITNTNNDNPVSTVANIGDLIIVFSSMSNAADSLASATIMVGSTQVATSSLVYNTTRGRYEAIFTVPEANGAWGNLNGNQISYLLTASDDAGNPASQTFGISAFTVDNTRPTISSLQWLPDPPLINVASGNPVTFLSVNADLGEPVSKGILDLSQYPGAPASGVLGINGNTVGTSSVSLSKYSQTDFIQATFTMYLYDQGGNYASTSKMFKIDTKRPQIVAARFDGTTLSIDFSETVQNIDISQISIRGTDGIGLATYTTLSTLTDTLVNNFNSCDVTLSLEKRKILTNWAAQPLSLWVKSDNFAPFLDLSGNWGVGIDNYPISLTSTVWRDPPAITAFSVSQTWPQTPSMQVDFLFSKNIDPATLLASNGVFFTTSSDFTSVDYRTGYVIQPTDTIQWVDQKHLKISLSTNGGIWFARKLGSGTATLKFATRTPASILLKDDLGKPMTAISVTSPLTATVSRPYTVPPPPFGFAIQSASSLQPVLDLSGAGTLTINTTDLALLYWSDFETSDQNLPLMGMPIPNSQKRVTAFQGAIQVWDLNVSPATYVTLNLQPLDINLNSAIASTQIILQLAPNDMQNVLGLYRNDSSPNLKLKVLSGAFMNWWGQPNIAYETSNPGNLQVIPGSPQPCQLAACALSTSSPVGWRNAGDLIFEFEILPSTYGAGWMPIASTTPQAQIVRLDDGTVVTTGTFLGWATRKVSSDSSPRFVARFQNASALPNNVQRVPSRADISNVSDAFQNKYNFSAVNVYNISGRSDSGPNGFLTASQTFVIDSSPPSVTGIIPSPGPIGQAPIGGFTCLVNYSESMDTSVAAQPSLELGTGTTTIPFFFIDWENSSQTAKFGNAQALTSLTPNGLWTYKTSGGRDAAANPLPAPAYSSLEIRTKSPAPSLLILTRQPKIFDSLILQNQPFSPLVGDGSATLRFDYVSNPDFVPHRLLVFSSSDIGIATFTLSPGNPAFSFFPNDQNSWSTGYYPGNNIGPVSYKVKVMDTIGNVSAGYVGSLTFDSRPPSVSSFTIADGGGIATDTGDGNGLIRYHSPLLGPAVINLQTDSNDPLLIVALPPGKTATEEYYLTNTSPSTNYSASVNTSSWSDGSTVLCSADLAGNFGTGLQPNLRIVLDRVAPNVIGVSPSRPFGVVPTGKGAFDLNFSKQMNTGIVPTVSLVFGSVSIRLGGTAPSCWQSRTVCRLTNIDPIVNLPIGTYTFQISGARDFAGNTVNSSSFQVWIDSQGTPATINVLTRQPRISNSVLVNSPYSPFVGQSSATIEISYSAAIPSNPPYWLLTYDSSGVNVATFGVVNGYPAVSTFSIDPGFWAPGKAPGANIGPLQYSFKLLDYLGNISDSSIGTITYDSLPTTITQLSFSDGNNGIASAGIRYYSPLLGAASITIQTDSTDAQRMMIASDQFSFPSLIQMDPNGSSHVGMIPVSIGECVATITFADPAGNIALGTGATFSLKIDRTPPIVIVASPSSRLGGADAEGKLFEITFSEPMQPAFVPDVRLELNSSIIQLKPLGTNPWKNPYTCRFTNRDPIRGVAVGTYTYMVWTGKDYAGNENLPASQQVYINSSGAIPPLTVLTKQPVVFPGVLINQPFSTLVGDGSASIKLDFASESLGAAPDQLLVFDNSQNQVATLPISAGTPGFAAFPGQFGYWASGKFPSSNIGPVEYSFLVLDALGNVSSTTVGKLVFDSKPAVMSNFTFDDGGRGLTISGVKYYSPALGSATITMQSDATDSQRLVIASSVATFPETAILQANGTTHSVIYGTSLADCLATFSVVDLAGNQAVGNKLSIQVDGTKPRVVSATPVKPLGALAPETGNFEISFSESMRTDVAPVASLRFKDYIITLKPLGSPPSCWKDSKTCRFTNLEALSSFITATYSYQISGATDFAGNICETPAIGSFPVYINPVDPIYQVVFRSRQDTISSDIQIDKAFSPFVSPFQGTLSFSKSNTAPNVPKNVWVYTPGEVPLASMPIIMNGTVGTVTVNAPFFKSPGEVGPLSYSLKVEDTNGFLSTIVKQITYDGLPPSVDSIEFPNVSDAATFSAFYNPLLQGDLTVKVKTQTPDSVRILLNGGAGTQSFRLDNTAFYYAGTIPASSFASISDGEVSLTVADDAGNLARGLSPSKKVILDRNPPTIGGFSSLPVSPIRYTPAGQATFTVVFSEPMNPLASGVPSLFLSTGTSRITCRFVTWINNTTAVFNNDIMIAGDAPQGPWDAQISGFDLANNRSNTTLSSALSISARGPIVTNWRAESYQVTTASQPYPLGVLVNAPFSMSIQQNSAILNFDVAQAPAQPVYLHFIDNNVDVATGIVAFSGIHGRFIWKNGTGPNPSDVRTYLIKLSDALGNYSLETFNWTADPVPPKVNSLAITGGVVSPINGSILFNPALQYSVNLVWEITGEALPPVLRVRSISATSTWLMSQNASINGSKWLSRFNGNDQNGLPLLEGAYQLDSADAAGNIGISTNGATTSAVVILDTTPPAIGTVTTRVNGEDRSRYAPIKGDLEIIVLSTDSLTPSGIWKVDITSDSGTLIKSVLLQDNAGSFRAVWNGTGNDGKIVPDGYYRLYPSDLTGNRSSSYGIVYLVNTEFKVTSVTQISEKSVVLNFNQNVDENSVQGAVVTFDPNGPIVNTLSLSAPAQIRVDIADSLIDSTFYKVTVGSGTVQSADGIPIVLGKNSGSFTADTKGPTISKVGFDGITNSRNFIVYFNEKIVQNSAETLSNYTLTLNTRQISLNSASMRSDSKSVQISTSEDLLSAQTYKVAAVGISDMLGNQSSGSSSEYSFKGIDLIPPVINLAAFSNPSNEYDVVIAVNVNEELSAAPTCTVSRGGTQISQVTMNSGTKPNYYMTGLSLDPSSSGMINIRIDASDLAGNAGFSETSFSVAMINASQRASVVSFDKRVTGIFPKGSLKANTLVKIIQQNIVANQPQNKVSGNQKSHVSGRLLPEYKTWAEITNPGSASSSQAQELTPIGSGYEISFSAKNLLGTFSVEVSTADVVASSGFGLFYLDENNIWQWVDSQDKKVVRSANCSRPSLMALMMDMKPPQLSIASSEISNLLFNDERPKFSGRATDLGSGLDLNKIVGIVDGFENPVRKINSDGDFEFVPVAPLCGGRHEIKFRAADRSGNLTESPSIRFEVDPGFKLGRIVSFPNPAREKSVIRIDANRGDIPQDSIEVAVYDSAGHRVRELDQVKVSNEKFGASARYLYEIPWDLKNEDGKKVANGVYFCKIKFRDPTNSDKQIKRIEKIAVLR